MTSDRRSIDEGWIEFETFDPQISVPLNRKINYVKISGEGKNFSFSNITKRVRDKDREISHLRNLYSYRIGKFVLFPVKMVTKLFIKK